MCSVGVPHSSIKKGLIGCGSLTLLGSCGAVLLLGGVALLEEARHLGVGFEALPNAEDSVSSCLQLDQDAELSASPAPCLPGHCHAYCCDINGLTLH